jgi:hypothetical protein
MMGPGHLDPWENRAWREPESDAARRAALDQVLAEWEQRYATTRASLRCPNCGRTAGEHVAGCTLSWLRLADGQEAAPDATTSGTGE